MPLLQAVADQRCISCDRWHGKRRPGAEPDTVEVASANVRGVCIEGPWHRNLRGVRSACGHWIRWRALAPPPLAENGANDQASLTALTEDVVKTSAIEGEQLNVESVRSSIARRLGVDIGALAPVDRPRMPGVAPERGN